MSKLRQLCKLIILLFISNVVYANVEVGHLFVQLSDAMEQVKRNEHENAKPYLLQLQRDFLAIPTSDSVAGKQVNLSLEQAANTPNLATLEQLSRALYTFEKEQNPIDYTVKRQQFVKRVMPVFNKLKSAVTQQDLAQIQNEYKRFNTAWTLNEKVVRNTSLGHYGQIETAMSLLRIAMLSEPTNYIEIQNQTALLNDALQDFSQGNVLQQQLSSEHNAPQDFISGIQLLEKSYQALSQGQIEHAKADITLFIRQWPIFEGDVRTRDAALYTRVESDLPLILVRGNDVKNLQHFRTLLDDLNQLDIGSHYGIVDAMLILLREGLEALVIVMALVTALDAAKQTKAKRWIYLGAGLGIAASILGAVALQQLFPAISAGTNREILEGIVGIIAVVMMLFVGGWLHSKSSLRGWQNFINHQVGKAITTGSLFSMLSLSFLSVFREGAETILFYVGILPSIELNDFLIGIGLACIVLLFIGWLMRMSGKHLPIPHLFKVMTLLLYLLGFKILGVSIHSLQLTELLARDTITAIPNIPFIGLYSSTQGLAAQCIYLFIIPASIRLFKKHK